MTKRKSNPEGGYALLFIFAMAAVVAIVLYKEMPRVAFEAQRDREQLLIDRGQEYSRAIALYVHKFNRFPGSMDDLNNTNNQRFLRRQFVDPMTGKADWRIVHAGPGGVLTDSVNNKIKATGDSISTATNMTVMQMYGVSQASSSEGVNLATRQRPSDGPGAPGMGPGGITSSDPNAGQNNNAAASNPSGNGTGIPGYNGPVMVLPDGRVVPATATGVPAPVGATGATGPGALPGFGIPGQPGMPPGMPPGAIPNLPNGVAIQTNNNGPNPSQINAPPGGAAGLINQLLTAPRPGGINGIGGMPTSAGSVSAAPGGMGGTPGTSVGTLGGATPPGQQTIGAGLAGVASKREQEGIKTYNNHSKYNEWEFVYDVTKDPSRTGQGAQPGAQGASGNQNQMNGPGQTGQSPFGGSSPLPGMSSGNSTTTPR